MRKVVMAGGMLLWVLGCMAQTAAGDQPQAATQMPQPALYDVLFMDAMNERQKGHNDAAFDLLQRCTELRPEASEAYYFLAQYYMHLKDNAHTLGCLKRAAELEPGNATYLETLAQAYVNSGEMDEAIKAVEQLYDKNKDRDDLLELLYRLYERQGDYEQAIATLNKMETANGKSEQLTYAKSDIYTQMGKTDEAVAEVKRLADQFPNDLQYQCRYADRLVQNDQEEEGVRIFRRVLAEEPENSHALISMRRYYETHGDSLAADSMALRVLDSRTASVTEKTFVLRLKIDEVERGSGDSTLVLSMFRHVLAQPQAPIELAALCSAYMELKKMPRDSIAPLLEYILRQKPDEAGARLQLVSYAWDDDDQQRIIELCQAARQYNPEEMAFYYYQGMAYYKCDDTDNALNAFRNGISVITEDSNPEIVSDFYAIMGDLLHQKGLRKEAFAAYDSCLQRKPDNIGCLNNYAYFLSERGEQLERAEQMSNMTVKAEPKNPTYLDTYAWILFMQKRYTEAKIYIDQTLQNDTTASAVILEHAGDIYYMNNDTEQALEYWRQALLQTPDNKLLTRKIKRKKYIKQ